MKCSRPTHAGFAASRSSWVRPPETCSSTTAPCWKRSSRKALPSSPPTAKTRPPSGATRRLRASVMGSSYPSTSIRSSAALKRVTDRLPWRWNWPKNPTRACIFCTSQRLKKLGCSATTSLPPKSASRLRRASTTSGSPMRITPRKAPTSSGIPPSKQRRIEKPSAPAS